MAQLQRQERHMDWWIRLGQLLTLFPGNTTNGGLNTHTHTHTHHHHKQYKPMSEAAMSGDIYIYDIDT